MPWEVALACNVHSDQSARPSHVGSHGSAVYVAYLSQLLGNQDSIHQSIVKEVFESDTELLNCSLSAVLEGAGHQYHHTHTEADLPKAGSHVLQWEHQQCLDFFVGMCCQLEVKECTQKALSSCRRAG